MACPDSRQPLEPGPHMAQRSPMDGVESLVSQAELARRWRVTPRTVNRRLAFLGIRALRQGRCRCLTLEQAALAERFHQHLSQGKGSSSFNVQEQDLLEPQVIPAQQPTGPIPGPDPQQLAAMAATFLARWAPLPPPVDPLQRSRALAEAADARLVLTTRELTMVLGHGIGGWRNSRHDYGFHFTRHKQQGKILWTVERSPWSTSPDSKPPPAEPHRTSGPFLGRMGQYRI